MNMFSSSSWSYSSSDESDDELYKYTYKMTSLQLASSKKIDKMMAVGGGAYHASKPASVLAA
jgi:hypothetical protein